MAVTVVEEADTVAEEPPPGALMAAPEEKKSTRTCPACKAPNPRRALTCLACGARLGRRRKDLLKDATASTATQSSEPAGEPDAASASSPKRRWALLVGGGILLAVVVAWWSGAFSGDEPSAPQHVPAALSAPESNNPPVSQTPVAEPIDDVQDEALVTTPAEPDLAPAVEQSDEEIEAAELRRKRQEAERVAAQARARTARIAKRQRERDERIQAARAAAAAEAAAAAAAKPAPAPPPVPAPRPVKNVAQTCAGETNVFARDFCRIDACRLPANVNDAICVSYRKMDAERRARVAR